MQIRSDQRTIELNASTVFQLLMFAESTAVRDAAASALEPLVLANPLLLECNGGPIDALPRWERIGALLIASLIQRNPQGACSLGVVAPGSLPPTRVFRYAFAAATTVDRFGLERISSTRATFALPVARRDMFVRLARRTVQTLDPKTDPGKGWNIDQAAAWLQLPHQIPTNATRWLPPRLVTPEGRLQSILDVDSAGAVKQRRLPLDASLLLRLESGALRGHLLTIVHRNRSVRADRAQDVVLSIELGGSMADPPVFSLHRGELAPRYDLRSLGHEGPVGIPPLGGATLGELDRLARQTGVWHGDHLRGSFAYHPLRAGGAVAYAAPREAA